MVNIRFRVLVSSWNCCFLFAMSINVVSIIRTVYNSTKPFDHIVLPDVTIMMLTNETESARRFLIQVLDDWNNSQKVSRVRN